jgi:putative FmdB family regulatory protein
MYIFYVTKNNNKGQVSVPTYEYRCTECNHHFEDIQSITAEPLSICPLCGRSTLKRLIGGGGGMIFKGSGFYGTDYRKKSGKEKTSPSAPKKKDEKGNVKDTSTPNSQIPVKTDTKSGSSQS